MRDQGRGIVGALLLGTPLLFTMETWWLAWRLPAWALLAFAFGGLGLILVAVRMAGFRADEERPHSAFEWARQFTELLFESFLAAAVVLAVFGVMRWEDTLTANLRLAVVAMVPLGLGGALANALLVNGGAEGRASLSRRVGLFALGAAFFALPIAPTEEVAVLAARAGWWRLAAVVVLTMAVTYLALYELGFRGQPGRVHDGLVDRVGETFIVYSLAFAVGVGLLIGYGAFAGDPPEVWVQEAVVLAFPAAMGGAAARVVF